eukprot:11039272-Alexandrium_andersonii.AAC.1
MLPGPGRRDSRAALRESRATQRRSWIRRVARANPVGGVEGVDADEVFEGVRVPLHDRFRLSAPL